MEKYSYRFKSEIKYVKIPVQFLWIFLTSLHLVACKHFPDSFGVIKI